MNFLIALSYIGTGLVVALFGLFGQQAIKRLTSIAAGIGIAGYGLYIIIANPLTVYYSIYLNIVFPIFVCVAAYLKIDSSVKKQGKQMSYENALVAVKKIIEETKTKTP